VAEPARRTAPDAPPLDPSAVERAYRLERAKRRARDEHARAARLAGVRFLVVIVVLLGLGAFLALTAWKQIESLFGL
jgi:hypothetical protein